MKLTVFLSFIILMVNFVYSNETDSRWVTAESGLRMRENPDLNAGTIVTIPYNEEVILLEEKGDAIVISGATGKWSRVKWKDKTGWVFGGFLGKSKNNNLTESDIEGEWFGDDGILMFTFYNDNRVDYNGPVELKNGNWSLSNSTIKASFATDDSDTEGPGISNYKMELNVLEHEPGYMKVELVQHGYDTYKQILEIYNPDKGSR